MNKNRLILIILLCLCTTMAMGFSITPGAPQLCMGATLSMSSDTVTTGSWASSNTFVANISKHGGVVTTVATGTTTVTYVVGTTTQTVVLTVNPNPSTSFTLDLVTLNSGVWLCPSQSKTVANSTAGGTWTSGNTSIATVDVATGLATGVAAGRMVFTYTMPTGCYSISDSLTVYANPAPISGALAVCTGNTTTLSSSTSLPSSTPFASSNIAIATVTSLGGVVTGIAAGTATITYSSTKCYTTAQVTVGAVIAGSGSVCVGSSISLSATPVGGTWASSDASKATVNSTTGVVTGISTGTANITYTSGTGCLAITTITVNSSVTAITGTAYVCEGGTTTLSNATGGGTWSSSNNAVATVNSSGVVSGIISGTATITYSISAGCYATVNVTVNANPAAITGPSIVASASTITLGDASSGGAWSSANTSVATVGTAGNVTGVNLGTTTITYTLPSGCYATATITVTVGLSGYIGVCFGATSYFTGHPGGGTWISSDPTVATVSSSGAVTAVSNGTAIISYTLSGQTATMEIFTHAMPSLSGTTTMCLGGTTTLYVNNYDDPFTWGAIASNPPFSAAAVDGANKTSSMSPIQSSVAPGTDLIYYQLYHNPGCQTTINVTTTANDSFTVTGTSLCEGATATLSATPAGGTWHIPHDPYYTEASITSGGVVTALTRINDYYSVVPIWYYTSASCMAYTQVTVNPASACGPKASNNHTETASGQLQYSVAPNPSDGNMIITQAEISDKPVSIRIISYTGITIYARTLSFTGGISKVQLEDNIPGGLYIAEIRDNKGGVSTQKIVIER
jgi:uncharacterized protein YjdB